MAPPPLYQQQTVQRFCSDLNRGRNFSGGVGSPIFSRGFATEGTVTEQLIFSKVTAQQFETLLHSNLKILLRINFECCIAILKCHFTTICCGGKCYCSAQQSWKCDCSKNLVILLLSNLEFSLPNDPETVLHSNLEMLLHRKYWNRNFTAQQSWNFVAEQSWIVTASDPEMLLHSKLEM